MKGEPMNSEANAAPTADFTGAARAYLEGFARQRAEAFSPEEVVERAAADGIVAHDPRSWGRIFSDAARDGLIRRAGLFARRTSNGSIRPGWCRA